LYLLPPTLVWSLGIVLVLFAGHAVAFVCHSVPVGDALRPSSGSGLSNACRLVVAVTAGVLLGFVAAQGVAEHRARDGISPVLGRVEAIHGVAADDLTGSARTGRQAYLPMSVERILTDRGAFVLPSRVVLKVGTRTRVIRGSGVAAEVQGRVAEEGAPDRFVVAASLTSVARGAAARRGELRAAISQIADAAGLELMAPLLIGSRGGLSDETSGAFRRAGALHMLALSGMHVALLLGLVYLITRGFGSWRLSVCAAMLFVLFFLWVAGPRPSLIRAVVLTLLSGLALLIGRRTAPINLLSVTFLFMAIVIPGATTELSFHLSFLALAGILLLSPVLDWTLDGWMPVWLRKPLSVGVGAQLATAPLAALTFGAVYPVGAFVSVVLAPLVTVYLWGCVAAAALHALGFPVLLAPLLRGLSIGESAILSIVRGAAHAPAVIFVSPASYIVGGAVALAFGVFILDVGRRRRRAGYLLAGGAGGGAGVGAA
jgi:ComEC/Rec2-related protein